MLNDIQIATSPGMSGPSHHCDATEHREQSEVVEGTHSSVASLERFNARAECGTYAWILYGRAEKRKLGECEDWICPLFGDSLRQAW